MPISQFLPMPNLGCRALPVLLQHKPAKPLSSAEKGPLGAAPDCGMTGEQQGQGLLLDGAPALELSSLPSGGSLNSSWLAFKKHGKLELSSAGFLVQITPFYLRVVFIALNFGCWVQEGGA